jgi:hypothetical protein
VPLKYVSTALGAHKAVSMFSIWYTKSPLINFAMLQIESCGITIMQTASGLTLDMRRKGKAIIARAIADDSDHAIQTVLNMFLCLNLLQLAGTIWLLRKDQATRRGPAFELGTSSVQYQPLAREDEETVGDALHEEFDSGARHGGSGSWEQRPRRSSAALARSSSLLMQTEVEGGARTDGELKRGRVFAIMAGITVGFTWVLFMVSAALRLRTHR